VSAISSETAQHTAATFCMPTRADGGLHLGWVVCRWGSSLGRKWNF